MNRDVKRKILIALVILYGFVFPIVLGKVVFEIHLMLSSSGEAAVILKATINIVYGILVIFNTFFVIKILAGFKKYGDNNSPFRKKYIKFSKSDIILAELNNLKTYQKSLIIKNNLIIINEDRVFEITSFNKKGTLTGDIKDDQWLIDGRKIDNPFVLKNEDINHYFVLNSNIIFKVTGVWLTSLRLIYDTLDKRLNKRIYDCKKIDEIYENIKVKYGHNED